MPRSSKKQQARPAVNCSHGEMLSLYDCLSLLQTLSTAWTTNPFVHSHGIRKFVELCTDEPCLHFKRSYMEDLLPALCKAAARALQLLHSSNEYFPQQSVEEFKGMWALLGSLPPCIVAFDDDAEPARVERLLAAVAAAGGSVTPQPHTIAAY